MIALLVGCAFLLVALHVFGSKPEGAESDEQRLEREHRSGLLTEEEYASRRAKMPHA